MKKIEDYVLSIPDFPEPGIIFRDITSVLQDADEMCIRDSGNAVNMEQRLRDDGYSTVIVTK